jgi:hypothetical protein
MIAREFHKREFNVIHLHPENGEQSQNDIEQRLLNRWFPYRNNFSLFDEENLTEAQWVDEAYTIMNAEMGYSMTEAE